MFRIYIECLTVCSLCTSPLPVVPCFMVSVPSLGIWSMIDLYLHERNASSSLVLCSVHLARSLSHEALFNFTSVKSLLCSIREARSPMWWRTDKFHYKLFFHIKMLLVYPRLVGPLLWFSHSKQNCNFIILWCVRISESTRWRRPFFTSFTIGCTVAQSIPTAKSERRLGTSKMILGQYHLQSNYGQYTVQRHPADTTTYIIVEHNWDASGFVRLFLISTKNKFLT